MQPATLELDSTEQSLLRTLADAGVRYVIIGGQAVNFYIPERPPNDLDIVIDRSEENARKLLAALVQLGVAGKDWTLQDLLQAGKQIKLPRYLVDIVTSVEPVPFSELIQDSVRVQVGTIEVAVVSLRHLTAQKRLLHRPQDVADYEALLKLV